MKADLHEILLQYEIRSYGICDFRRISSFLPCRNQEQIPEEAKSVIVCAFPYYVGEYPQANICKYAMVPDYHYIVRRLLSHACTALSKAFSAQFVGFSDISALPERECALAAGLGFPGVNGLVIHPQYGTFFVIGEIVTDYLFPFDQPLSQTCLHCGNCIRLCPSGAISQTGIDYSHCLSAITQQKGELSPQEQDLVQKNSLIWGCDCCQNCCPHNQNLPTTYLSDFSEDVVPIVNAENLSPLMKTRAFGYKGKKLLQRNLNIVNRKPE